MTVLVPAARCDCRVCPFYVDNPTAAEPVCSGCNSSCSYCGCARAEGAYADCGQCPIRCGSRVDITAWMADASGTVQFDDIRVDMRIPPELPKFIPQVDGHGLERFDRAAQWGAYAIGLRRVLSPDTHRIFPKFTDTSAHEALGLPAERLLLLTGYGEDPLVEAFWTRRHQLIPELVAMGWDIIQTPNFSMYGNQPRAEHLLNMRRNLTIAAEFAAAGAPCPIPNIYWYRLEDLQRYVTWLEATRPAAIAINLQTYRTDTDWSDMALPGLTYLSLTMPAGIKVLVTGASRADRISQLTGLFPNLHLVAQNAQAYARHGAVMTPSGRQDVKARVEDAFAANVRFYDQVLTQEAK